VIAGQRLGGEGIANHHVTKHDMARRTLRERVFNMLDRFPPRLPEQGENMAKVQQSAGKEHGKDMVILPCSPLFVLLPVRREPMSVQCTALPMCGGMRTKRKRHAGALA
jgi:hypothetical protein